MRKLIVELVVDVWRFVGYLLLFVLDSFGFVLAYFVVIWLKSVAVVSEYIIYIVLAFLFRSG